MPELVPEGSIIIKHTQTSANTSMWTVDSLISDSTLTMNDSLTIYSPLSE